MSLNPQVLTIALPVRVVPPSPLPPPPTTHPHLLITRGPENSNRYLTGVSNTVEGGFEWKSLDCKDPTWLLFERREMFIISFSCAQEVSGFLSELKIYLLSKIGSQGVCRAHISPTRPTPR